MDWPLCFRNLSRSPLTLLTVSSDKLMPAMPPPRRKLRREPHPAHPHLCLRLPPDQDGLRPCRRLSVPPVQSPFPPAPPTSDLWSRRQCARHSTSTPIR